MSGLSAFQPGRLSTADKEHARRKAIESHSPSKLGTVKSADLSLETERFLILDESCVRDIEPDFAQHHGEGLCRIS